MDVESIAAQLDEVNQLLEKESGNAAYLQLQQSLKEALELAKQAEEEEEDDDDDDDDGDDDDDDDDEDDEDDDEDKGDDDEGKKKEKMVEENVIQEQEQEQEEEEEEVEDGAKGKDNESRKRPRNSTASPSSEPPKTKAKSKSEGEIVVKSDVHMQKANEKIESKIMLGSRCEVFDDGTTVWQGATLENYQDESGKPLVRLLHNDEIKRVQPNAVRKLKKTCEYNQLDLKIGTKCRAMYSGDGKWYPAMVIKLTLNGAVVEFKKYRNSEQVAFEHLVIQDDDHDVTEGNVVDNVSQEGQRNDSMKDSSSSSSSSSGSKSKYVSEVPKHLQVKEADSQRTKKEKRRKLKELKKGTSEAQEALILEQNKQNWQAFQAKLKKKKKKKKKKTKL